jgi:uncharacterized membrane protein
MVTGLFAFAFGPFGGVLAILYFIFWLWMLICCLKNKKLDGTERLIWVLVIIIAQVIGPILYFILIKDKSNVTHA